jgi:hypothetical protein
VENRLIHCVANELGRIGLLEFRQTQRVGRGFAGIAG